MLDEQEAELERLRFGASYYPGPDGPDAKPKLTPKQQVCPTAAKPPARLRPRPLSLLLAWPPLLTCRAVLSRRWWSPGSRKRTGPRSSRRIRR